LAELPDGYPIFHIFDTEHPRRGVRQSRYFLTVLRSLGEREASAGIHSLPPPNPMVGIPSLLPPPYTHLGYTSTVPPGLYQHCTTLGYMPVIQHPGLYAGYTPPWAIYTVPTWANIHCSHLGYIHRVNEAMRVINTRVNEAMRVITTRVNKGASLSGKEPRN